MRPAIEPIAAPTTTSLTWWTLSCKRDAEQVANALDQSFTGIRPFDAAMGDYQRMRDEHSLAMYEFTCQLATLEPPPPEMQQMLGAIQGNQKAMDGFAQMNAGTISPMEFGSQVATAAGLARRA